MAMFKVLFLCTENACRTQMAEGLINHDLKGEVQAFSAGVRATRVNPRAIQVMAEIGIDISRQRSKSMDEFREEQFDLAITLCDQAQRECPMFLGRRPSDPYGLSRSGQSHRHGSGNYERVQKGAG